MVGVPMKEKPQSKIDCPNIIPNKISSRERRSTESSTESESSEDEEGALEVNCPEIEEELTVSGKELTLLKNGSPKLIPKTRRFLKRKRTDSSTESDSSENNEENTDENCLRVEEKLTVSEKEMTLSKNDSRRLQKKKRMESSTDSSEEDTLPESCLEVEDNLNKSALRNNLSADDVKTILKKVVSNEHVLALVKLREEELLADEGNAVPEPKLTRSKIKELRNTSSAVPWTIPLTPVKNNPVTSPEVTALIVQDMPEEESDEEYDPAHDEESDDGEPLEFHSDVDSQPKTPATPGNSSILELESPTIPINWSKDGLFKIPKVILHEISNLTPTKGKMTKEEEATIARRTRSKLSFSDTPIEQLQDSFVPPDIPADMYDFEEIHRMDNVWRDFLQEFMKPLPQSHEEADDDADPEYNHQADSNTLIEDEVLDNAEARVSRRELNDLVAELFDDIDFPLLLPLTSNTNPEQVINDEQQNANALLDNSTDSLKILDLDVHNTDIKYESFVKSQEVETEISKEVEEIQGGNDEIIGSATEEEERFPISVKDERVCAQIPLEPSVEQQEEGKATIVPPYIIVEAAGFSALHRGMLQQQLRMHVQFLIQNFIQAYGHPELWDLGPKLKQMMTHLIEMAGSLPESIFSVCNLQPAFELLQEWEAQLSEDTPENQEYIRFVKKECDRIKRKHGCHIKHVQNFPPNIIKIIANSPVFLYPHLLPPQPFRVDLKRTMRDQTKKWQFIESEDHYISLGFEQFEKFIKKQRRKKFKKKQREVSVKDICEMMTPHMLPFVTAKSVISRIGNVRNANRATEGHPILYYFQHGKVKETKHNVFPYDMKKAPKDYSSDILPGVWKKYCGEGRVFSSLENKKTKSTRSNVTTSFNNENGTTLTFAPSKTQEKLSSAVLNENGQIARFTKTADIADSRVAFPRLSTLINTENAHPTSVSSLNSPILQQAFSNNITLSNNIVKAENLTLILQPNLSSGADVKPVQILQSFNSANTVLNVPINNEEVPRSLQSGVAAKGISIAPKYTSSNSPIVTENQRLFENCVRAVNRKSSFNRVIFQFNVDEGLDNFEASSELISNSDCRWSGRNVCSCEDKTPKILKGQTFLTQYFKRKDRVESNLDIENKGKQSADGISDHPSTTCIDEDGSDSSCTLLKHNNVRISPSTIHGNDSNRNISKRYFKLVNRNSLSWITIKLSYLIDLCKEVFEVRYSQEKDKGKSTSLQLFKARSILSSKLLELDKMLPSMPFLSTADNSLQDLENRYENETTADISGCFPTFSEDGVIVSSKSIGNKPTNGSSTPGGIPDRNNIILSVDNNSNNFNDNLVATAYFEKVLARLNTPSQRDHTMSSYSHRFMEFQSILDTFDPSLESPDVLYQRLEAFFGRRDADLADEFLLFLTPSQAAAAGRFMDHFVLMNMSQFVEQLQVVFARKPATIRKILRNLQLALNSIEVSKNDPEQARKEVDKLKTVVLPHLRASPTLTDLFLKFLPEERPPESAYPTTNWEIFPENLWMGQSSSEGAEVVEAGTSEKGSLYCACVRSHGMNPRRNRKYCCIACGMTYMQGQVFVQRGRVLRPARIVFCDSQLLSEQQAVRLSGSSQPIARTNQSDDENVSPKRMVKNIKTPSSKSKHQKTKATKPDGIEGTAHRKPSCSKTLIKNSDNAGDANVDDSFRPLERHHMETSDTSIPESNTTTNVAKGNDPNPENSMDTYEENVIAKPEVLSPDSIFTKPNQAAINWTRDEDKTILQVLQCESDSEQTFVKINELMPHRSMQEIRERFHSVMDFLQEMASSQ